MILLSFSLQIKGFNLGETMRGQYGELTVKFVSLNLDENHQNSFNARRTAILCELRRLFLQSKATMTILTMLG